MTDRTGGVIGKLHFQQYVKYIDNKYIRGINKGLPGSLWGNRVVGRERGGARGLVGACAGVAGPRVLGHHTLELAHLPNLG